MSGLKAALLATAVGLTCGGAAQAGVYTVYVEEGLSNGFGFDTLNVSPYNYGSGNGNVAAASFTYSGALVFSNTQGQNDGPTGDLNDTFGFSRANISEYAGAGTVRQGGTLLADYTTLDSFLASSGSAGNFKYGSYYAFDLGALAAGTVLTITHDDGTSLFQGNSQIGAMISGPTSQVTNTVELGRSADTFLYYSRQNGTPSILRVAVPEPVSLSLVVAGLVGLSVVRRRRARRKAA